MKPVHRQGTLKMGFVFFLPLNISYRMISPILIRRFMPSPIKTFDAYLEGRYCQYHP